MVLGKPIRMSNIKIAVIGLGYVGLPLARLFATKYVVVGFDINQQRVSELMQGNDATLEVGSEELQSVLVEKRSHKNGLFCSSHINDIKDCNYYIICLYCIYLQNPHSNRLSYTSFRRLINIL